MNAAKVVLKVLESCFLLGLNGNSKISFISKCTCDRTAGPHLSPVRNTVSDPEAVCDLLPVLTPCPCAQAPTVSLAPPMSQHMSLPPTYLEDISGDVITVRGVFLINW